MDLHAPRRPACPSRHRVAPGWLLAVTLAAAPWTTAWATRDFIAPAPVLAAPVLVKVQAHADLPRYAVPGPNSDLVLGFDNSAGPGLMLGALGVAAAAATQRNAGDAVTASLPQVTLLEPARRLIRAWSADPAVQGRFLVDRSGEAAGPVLEVVPLGILSFTDRERRSAQAFVELRAKLMDGQQQVLWRTRYVASTGGIRPIGGDTGWSAQQGAALTASMDASLRAGLGFLLQDLARPGPRTAGAPFKAEVYVPRQDKPWTLDGQAIAQDANGHVLIASGAHDAHVTGGLFVLERSRFEAMPAVPGAPAVDAPVAWLPASAPPAASMPPDSAPDRPSRWRAVTAADVDGHTWRYAHPRDPGRFGDVRLAFRDGRVEASNARSHTQGRYEVRNGKLCITYDHDSWPASCLSLVEGADGAPMLWTNTLGRALPLFIE